MNNINKKTVVVGLSGGVDSSVTAALLKERGFEVTGVYMKNWDDQSPTLGRRPLATDEYRSECSWYEEYLDAKRVALVLNIPFQTWDFRAAYKQKVFDAFIDEFAKGRTPNPDIYCNSRLKFDDFQARAIKELGAHYVATGHYARVSQNKTGYQLSIPKDTHKDQTYFLYRLNQEQLSKTLFPLADYTKAEVRLLAKKFNLPTKYKKDSQGLCFVGNVEVRQLVSQWLAPKPGSIIDEDGQVIGQHRGAHLYTIGERIAVNNSLVAKHYPKLRQSIPHFYVAAKNIEQNTVSVVPGADHPNLYATCLTLTDFVAGGVPNTPVLARVRHTGELIPIKSIAIDAQRQVKLVFQRPARAIASGQHVVLYKEGMVVGGGVVVSATR